jgi:hypothetical protein
MKARFRVHSSSPVMTSLGSLVERITGAYIEDRSKSRARKCPPRRRRKVVRANVRVARDIILVFLDLYNVRVCIRAWILVGERLGAVEFGNYHLFNLAPRQDQQQSDARARHAPCYASTLVPADSSTRETGSGET